jgi:serine/threonine protein kinase
MSSPTLDEAAIFSAARQFKDADARRRYIEGACEGDSALKSRLEALLLIDQADRGFLERPAQGVATRAAAEITDAPGGQIGPYTLLEVIGEGGFGKVFVAEQQHPVPRKVALKIIKPGMDTHHVVARFESERRALALMAHPNIAHLIDGGATPSATSATRTSTPRQTGSSFSSRSARPSSTPITRASSIATSSPPT